jgi:hypothetical protein
MGAKDLSNHLVAGYRRSFPQDSSVVLQFYEVKRMIRDSGALFSLHPFSNFKYVRSPCYLIERGHSNVPTLVGHFW